MSKPVWFLLAVSLPFAAAHWTAMDLGHLERALRTDVASDTHHFAPKQLADFPNEASLPGAKERFSDNNYGQPVDKEE